MTRALKHDAANTREADRRARRGELAALTEPAPSKTPPDPDRMALDLLVALARHRGGVRCG
jgi:hypothetical protein